MKHILRKPDFDPAKRREFLKLVDARFITSAERKARVAAKMKVLGIPSFNRLAADMGMATPWLYKVLSADRPTLQGIERLAVALDCSVSYLTEKEI